MCLISRNWRVAVALAGTLGLLSCEANTLAPEAPVPGASSRRLEPSSSSSASLGASRTSDFGFALDEDDDDEGGCARSPGFWCQNNDGHPHLSASEFETIALDAIALLAAEGITDFSEVDDIRAAVCDTGRQLLRHLTSLALNLAAGYLTGSEPLTGDDALVGDVQAAFSMAAATYLAGDSASFEARRAAKDVLDRINNNENIENACTSAPGGGGGAGGGPNPQGPPTPSPGGGPPSPPPGNGPPSPPPGNGPPSPNPSACALEPDGKITICHLPPGNAAKALTLRISPSAWPAHEAHGDSCGVCN